VTDDPTTQRWATCSCSALHVVHIHPDTLEGATVHVVCECDEAFATARVIATPRCATPFCKQRATELVGEMARCSWCAARPREMEVADAAE
jgi:hypothetical protein